MKTAANLRRPCRTFSFLTRISQYLYRKNYILKRDRKKLTNGLSSSRQGRDAACQAGCGRVPQGG
jgi:hypothetical protein